jgi:hypothetical protein
MTESGHESYLCSCSPIRRIYTEIRIQEKIRSSIWSCIGIWFIGKVLKFCYTSIELIESILRMLRSRSSEIYTSYIWCIGFIIRVEWIRIRSQKWVCKIREWYLISHFDMRVVGILL